MASFRPRYVAMITAALCAGIYGVGQMKDLKTPGMQNIENRHSSAGGSGTHTPAAASPMGRADLKEGKQDTQKGVGSKHWQENFGDQHPEPSPLGKKFNQANHGSDKGLRS